MKIERMALGEHFSEKSLTVLRIILNKRMVRGGELMKEARLESGQDLLEAIQPLVDQGLIKAVGQWSNPELILGARFLVQPSNFGYLQKLMMM